MLSNDDPVSVARMILWMYHDEIAFSGDELSLGTMLQREPLVVPNTTTDEPGQTLIKAPVVYKMYEIADQFDIPTLKAETIRWMEALIEQDIEAFWSLRTYLSVSDIDCAPLRETYDAARSDKANALRKDARFKDLMHDDQGFWMEWFSNVADERNDLEKGLKDAKKTSKEIEVRMQGEIDTWKAMAPKRKRSAYSGPHMTSGGHGYTTDHRPICDDCGDAGHVSRNCPD